MDEHLRELLSGGAEVVFTPLLFDGERLRYFALWRTEQDAAVGSGDSPAEALGVLHQRWKGQR